LLAKAGLEVVIIERGEYPGSKNVSGGLIFSKIYNDIFPNFWEEAPVERSIVGHSILFLGDDASTAVDFRSGIAAKPPYNAFSVLRAKFDPWLAGQAEEAGAMLIPGYTVDELLVEDGKVRGVKAGEDELPADVVIIAEGGRSHLLKKAGLREDFSPKDVSIGVKEVIQLSEDVINERFRCEQGQGVAYTTVGQTAGVEGGGFLYTNKDSLSLGVVAKIDGLARSGRQPHELLDEYKSHPTIAQMVKGGEVVEYSAQTVHRGGLHLIPKLYGNGYLVAGSAARLLLNNIMTLRGMDLAVVSAAAAARAVLAAKEAEDFSESELAAYDQYIQDTSVYQDMVTFKNTYPLLENKRLFTVYPDLVCNVMEDMFGVESNPSKKAYRSLRDNLGDQVSMFEMVKDLYQIGRGIVI
jgi:electron transfer flavoprotein-quinone oxidoreductase